MTIKSDVDDVINMEYEEDETRWWQMWSSVRVCQAMQDKPG